MVGKFLIERFMSVHHFDGCMMGVLGNNGQPMKKSWTIAGKTVRMSMIKVEVKHLNLPKIIPSS